VTAPKPRSRFAVGLVSLLGVLGFLLFLAFLPDWLRKTHFKFETGDRPVTSEKSSFPLEQSFAVVAGKSALPAALKNRDKVTLAELAGTAPQGLLLNFWATWCPPCLDELPGLDYLHRQLQKQEPGAVPLLVTISVDEAAQDISNLFETLDFSPTLIVLHDPSGSYSARMGTTRFPETFWIDPSGSVRHKWVGPQNWLSEEVLVTLKRGARI
jgi:thiol-disulfide isomerase/thioredoxin